MNMNNITFYFFSMKHIIILSIVFFLAIPLTYAQNSDATTPEEYTYDEKNQLKMYCFRPSQYNPKEHYPAIVIFHGGGWSIGEASWGFSTAQHFANKGMIAFSVQYRLQDAKKKQHPLRSCT